MWLYNAGCYEMRFNQMLRNNNLRKAKQVLAWTNVESQFSQEVDEEPTLNA